MIHKIYLYTLIFSAIAISSLSGFFSVIGFSLIFKSIIFSISALAILLELSKVLISVYLHLYFKKENKLLIFYLTIALITLMAINSLGVYSYLSKGYLDSFNSEEVSSNIEISKDELQNKKEAIENNKESKKDKLDEKKRLSIELNSVDDEEKKKIRKKINKLSDEITKLLESNDKLNEEIKSLKSSNTKDKKEINKIETELGPIKYLALLIYSSEDREIINKSMRIFIVILIIVFDPLAIISLIAAISALEKLSKKDIKQEVKENIIVTTTEINKPKIIKEEPIIEKQEEQIEAPQLPRVNIINTSKVSDKLEEFYKGE
jgi:hypothetical protein